MLNLKILFTRKKFLYIIYADFESLLEPLNDEDSYCKTSRYQKHIEYSAQYYLKYSYNNDWSYYESSRSLDCMSWFAAELRNVPQFISSKLQQVEPMDTEVSLKDTCKNFHICEAEFKEKDIIVGDHWKLQRFLPK